MFETLWTKLVVVYTTVLVLSYIDKDIGISKLISIVDTAPTTNNGTFINDTSTNLLPSIFSNQAQLSLGSQSLSGNVTRAGPESSYRNQPPNSLHNELNKHGNNESQQQYSITSSARSQYSYYTGDNNTNSPVLSLNGRYRRHQEVNPDCEFSISRKPIIYGIRSDHAEVTEDGALIIRASKETKVYLIGRNLYSNLSVALTPSEGASQDDCTHTDRVKTVPLFNISSNIAEIIIDVPSPMQKVPYYLCLREHVETAGWFHQGSDPWLKVYVKQDFMPLYMKLIVVLILLMLSGLFSGLNLGLMALDKNELQVIMKCGTTEEKQYARIIEPLRRRGNYLLCTVLFSNTLVNATISVILEDLSDGLIAVMTATVLIVIFGEILPQAFCSRHGLAVGAKTIWITRLCMLVTFPLSYPVSTLLDLALGEEIGQVYDREKLTEFIHVTRDINNLEADEVNIITGALKIKKVPISEVMTPIDDVYMLNENSVLDFDTIQTIVGQGFSRIPIHEEGNRKNIKAVLFAKDLALVDPDDRTPVQTMINFYNHPRMFVFEDTKLDQVLNEFKTGRSHLAIVQKIIDDGERDPSYEVIGIVTLEDVIEEILATEINDETDTLTDNRKKRTRKDAQVRRDLSHFTNLGGGESSHNVRVTPQLCLAAYQYLATSVEPFSPKYLSDSILKRLLSQKIFYKVRMEDDESKKKLYKTGEPADYFIMILEGRVNVICGRENLIFDGGPFSFFGRAALTYFDEKADAAESVAKSSIQALSTRRESTLKPSISRRESIARIVSNQLPIPGVSSSKKKEVTSAIELTGSPHYSGDDMTSELVEKDERGVCFFRPDYTVDIITNTSYLKVTRNDYLTALKATQLERECAATSTDPGEEIVSNVTPGKKNSSSFVAASDESLP